MPVPSRPPARRPPLLLAAILRGVPLLAVLLLAGPPVQAAPVAGVGPPPRPATATGALRPVPGEVVRPFDPPAHEYGPGHRGVDLAAQPGDPVRAALGGRITYAGLVAGTGWVTIDHGGGLVTTYGPVEQRLPAGSAVARGAVVGAIAVTGRHLDWGARLRGAYLDPLLLLAVWRMHLTGPP